MLTRRQFAAALMAMGWLAGPRGAKAEQPRDEVVVGLPNTLFANMQSGKPSGIILESIDLVLKRMERRPAYVIVAASELADAVRDGSVGLGAAAVLPPGRDGDTLFSAPIVTEYHLVAVRAGTRKEVKRVADLRGLLLGGRDGHRYPLLEADPDIELLRFHADGDQIRNLIQGRIDAAIIGALSDTYGLRTEGVMSRIEILGHAVGAVPLRALLSPKRFAPSDLGEFDRVLAEVQAGPAWTAILERNAVADLVRQWPLLAA